MRFSRIGIFSLFFRYGHFPLWKMGRLSSQEENAFSTDALLTRVEKKRDRKCICAPVCEKGK